MTTQKEQTDYTGRNNLTSAFYHWGEQTATENAVAGTFKRRIGKTVYHVNVYHSRTSSETINDKITRLIKNDISGKEANQ